MNTWLSAGQGGGLAARAAFAAVCCLAVAACGKVDDLRRGAVAANASDADADAGYVRPPELREAVRGPAGVVLEGQAEPNSRVRLTSPDGAANGGTVTADGVWSMPAGSGAGIFGLSEDLGGRIVQGEGYIVTLPAPGRPAALLRAGGGAKVMAPHGGAGLSITAADFDAGGGAVISGFAPAGAGLRLEVDGVAASGEVKANTRGRFFIAAPASLKPGRHTVRVQAGGQIAAADIVVSPAAPISGQPFRVARQDHGWRVDWMTPGGGQQTSLILDP